MKNFKYLISLLVLLSACHSQPLNPRLSEEWKPLKKSRRHKLVKRNTKNYQQYRGLDLLFDINVTYLSSLILDDNLKKRSQFMMWSSEQAQDEASKLKIDKLNKSYFFITVYSSRKKLNQLNLKASDWTATVVLNDGSVFKGKIKLHQNINDHNSVFYSHVESWDKNYMITFDVGTTRLAQEKFTFDITSPRGSARFNF